MMGLGCPWSSQLFVYKKEYIEIMAILTHTRTQPKTHKMGIHILCNGESYSCGYTAWSIFREEVANAAIRYLRLIYDQLLSHPDDERHEEQTCIEKIIEYVEVNNCDTIEGFFRFFTEIEFQNAFNYFELGGVYALLNKGDDEGYYTVGNSLDIADTMELIEPHIIYDDVKTRYDLIKKVFEESVLTRKVVSIC